MFLQTLHHSKIAPESEAVTERDFFPGPYFPGQQNLRGRNLCNEINVSGWHYLVLQ